MTTCPHCDAMERQIDDLNNRLRLLTEAFNENPAPWVAGLTHNEALLCQHIRYRAPNPVTKSGLMNVLYAHRPYGDEPDLKIIDVFVCKARKKLDRINVQIDTVWGQGYRMPADSVRRWDAANQAARIA